MRRHLQRTAAATLALIGTSAANAQESGCYELLSGSFVDTVCTQPCDCQTQGNWLEGTFELEDLSGDGTFYSISNIDITVTEPIGILDDTGVTRIQGFGVRYTSFIGTLELPPSTDLMISVDGAPHQWPRDSAAPDNFSGEIAVLFRYGDPFVLCPLRQIGLNATRATDACDTACNCDLIADGTVGVDDLLFYLDLWFDNRRFAIRVTPDSAGIENLLDYLDCWLDASINGC